MLKTYNDFIEYVESLGLVSFYGRFLEGFPKLEDLTEESQWFTKDPNTNPWQWKDRVTEEKRLAFCCLLGGHKGFISRKLYPLFYAACHPEQSIPKQYADGKISQTMFLVYKLFENGAILSTTDIRRTMGVNKKQGTSKVDAAIVALQKQFIIAVCGSQQKLSSDGKEYGWPTISYCRVEDWAQDWLDCNARLKKNEAIKQILSHCASWDMKFDINKLETLLFGKG